MLYDILSVWEIAHRWNDQDPNITNPQELPLKVQDVLRFVSRELSHHNVASFSSRGVENRILRDMMNYAEFYSANGLDLYSEKVDSEKLRNEYEDYCEMYENKCSKHDQLIIGLDKCFEQREYDKNKLDSIFISQHELAKLCLNNDVPLPIFWYPSGKYEEDHQNEAMEVHTKKLRPNQMDKLVVQAVAKTLWDINPTMTKVDVIGHKAIKIYAGGRNYVDKTVRDWLLDIDPRSEEEKQGRPLTPKKSIT